MQFRLRTLLTRVIEVALVVAIIGTLWFGFAPVVRKAGESDKQNLTPNAAEPSP